MIRPILAIKPGFGSGNGCGLNSSFILLTPGASHRESRMSPGSMGDHSHFGIPSAELENESSAFQEFGAKLHGDCLTLAGHQREEDAAAKCGQDVFVHRAADGPDALIHSLFADPGMTA